MPRPLGVFAVNDALALQLQEGALRRGWRLPEDLALLGMDDSGAAAAAGLSSVQLPRWRWGRAAGEVLLARLASPGAAAQRHLVPPDEISPRASSAGLQDPDPLLEAALALIDERGTTLTVADLARQLAVGERRLLRRLRAVCATSPSRLLRERRLQEARRLLRNSAASLEAVARRAGFRSRQGMARAFAELTGSHPAEHRRLRRGRRPPIEP